MFTIALSLLAMLQSEWAPPSREMPQMPAISELAGGGLPGSLEPWFRGVGFTLAEIRATGEGPGARPRLVRFSNGPHTIEIWSDRNGDGRADRIELFRDGRIAGQFLDADFDGSANVLRMYDATGGLAREERY